MPSFLIALLLGVHPPRTPTSWMPCGVGPSPTDQETFDPVEATATYAAATGIIRLTVLQHFQRDSLETWFLTVAAPGVRGPGTFPIPRSSVSPSTILHRVPGSAKMDQHQAHGTLKVDTLTVPAPKRGRVTGYLTMQGGALEADCTFDLPLVPAAKDWRDTPQASAQGRALAAPGLPMGH